MSSDIWDNYIEFLSGEDEGFYEISYSKQRQKQKQKMQNKQKDSDTMDVFDEKRQMHIS